MSPNSSRCKRPLCRGQDGSRLGAPDSPSPAGDGGEPLSRRLTHSGRGHRGQAPSPPRAAGRIPARRESGSATSVRRRADPTRPPAAERALSQKARCFLKLARMCPSRRRPAPSFGTSSTVSPGPSSSHGWSRHRGAGVHLGDLSDAVTLSGRKGREACRRHTRGAGRAGAQTLGCRRPASEPQAEVAASVFWGGYRRGVFRRLWALEGAACHGKRLDRRPGAWGPRCGSALRGDLPPSCLSKGTSW